MENYYQYSGTINAIEKACDLVQVGYTKNGGGGGGGATKSRKRSRESLDGAQVDEVFKEIYLQMDYCGVYPTFRSFSLAAFYILVSVNEQNEYHQQVMNCIVEFRKIIAQSDKLLFQNRLQDVYFLIVDDLITLLRRSQQTVLLFHLSCENKVIT